MGLASDKETRTCADLETRVAIAQEQRKPSVSGIEELVPVADKQDLESVGDKQPGFPVIQPPVKRMEEDKKDILDNDEIDGGTETEEALKKCPKSPAKNLFVRNSDNPKSTKFEWVEVQDSSQESSEGIIIDKETGDIDSDFLEKVEEIFDDRN